MENKFLSRLSLIIFISAALIGAALWLKFSLPQYQLIDLSVSKSQAISKAKVFLNRQGYSVDGYREVVVFSSNDDVSQYLQKTLGINRTKEFLKEHDMELCSWRVRFFKEQQKEEFRVELSTRTGEVLHFTHVIPDTTARALISKEQAKLKAEAFLSLYEGINLVDYDMHSEDQKKYDLRTDYGFVWEKKGVFIPWTASNVDGGAKILNRIVMASEEVLSFSKYEIDIPDAFKRYLHKMRQTGEDLTLIFKISYLLLLTLATMVVVQRKDHGLLGFIKKFYVGGGVVLFCLFVVDVFNNLDYFLYNYPTSQDLNPYIVQSMIQNIIAYFFMVLPVVLCFLAGEAVVYDQKYPNGGFFKFLSTSFLKREVSYQILLGYLGGIVLLGAQALIYQLGYRYCGVWQQLSWISQTSFSVFPAITLLLISILASFSEESMFRLFGINFARKYVQSTAVAVLLTSLAWGLGHTAYEIYPTWFRGLEVTCLGVILGFLYLRYGLITAIVAHFFMDAWLLGLPYLMGRTISFDVWNIFVVLALPLVLALFCFAYNKKVSSDGFTFALNKKQKFNLQLLTKLLSLIPTNDHETFKKQLLAHGWDPMVIEAAFGVNLSKPA